MGFTAASYPGTLHHFDVRLTAFEHPNAASSDSSPHNTILFIGGLGDGLLHPNYPKDLAQRLPPGWTLCEVLLSSAYAGWGSSSLARDAKELAIAIKYFRSLPGRSAEDGGKIVIMGHSTGSQICMEYIAGPWKAKPIPATTLDRPRVDGVILQAGISDREALRETYSEEEYHKSLATAQAYVADGRGRDMLPGETTKRIFFGNDPSAERWVSLLAVEGDDDYFSSDLRDENLERTFGEYGRRKIPLSILFGGADEYVPTWVDREGLVKRWVRAVETAGGKVGDESGVIKGVTHNLSTADGATRSELFNRVLRFIASLT